LIAPIELRIDSKSNHFGIEWKGFGNAKFVVLSDDFKIAIRLFFWKKDISLLKGDWRYLKPQKESKTSNPKRKNSTFSFSGEQFMKLIKSWKIREWKLDVDLNNVIINSYLFPMCYVISNDKNYLHINYMGKNEVKIIIQNSIGRMLNALYFNRVNLFHQQNQYYGNAI
jgi:hypothetical protein